MAQDGIEISGVAGRYASALYELASQKGAADDVAAAFGRVPDHDQTKAPICARLVSSPVFPTQEQVKALQRDPRHSAGIGGVAANFIKLVATKRRFSSFPT